MNHRQMHDSLHAVAKNIGTLGLKPREQRTKTIKSCTLIITPEVF
jgi:hypothetical protein